MGWASWLVATLALLLWLVVSVLAITEPVSWGVLYYGFGVLLAPMQAETGWSRAALTGAFSLALVVWGLTAVPVGRWLDQHGARSIMMLGSCLAVPLSLPGRAANPYRVLRYLAWYQKITERRTARKNRSKFIN